MAGLHGKDPIVEVVQRQGGQLLAVQQQLTQVNADAWIVPWALKSGDVCWIQLANGLNKKNLVTFWSDMDKTNASNNVPF